MQIGYVVHKLNHMLCSLCAKSNRIYDKLIEDNKWCKAHRIGLRVTDHISLLLCSCVVVLNEDVWRNKVMMLT